MGCSLQKSARSFRRFGTGTSRALTRWPGVYGSALMTKLVIVDDHEALREGLVALLQHGGIEVVGAAGNVAAGSTSSSTPSPTSRSSTSSCPTAAAST